MNRRIFFIVAAIMVMAIGVAGFAYKRSTAMAAVAACACCGDSCPMKKSGASATDAKSCCDGDSCPMHKGEKMAASHKDGMPESCPMHNGGAKAQDASATAETKKSYDCSCCDHNRQTAAVPAV